MCLESYVLQDNTMHGDDRCGFVGTLLCDTTIDAERLASLVHRLQSTATEAEALAVIVLAGARQLRLCSHELEEDGELKTESTMNVEGSLGLYKGCAHQRTEEDRSGRRTENVEDARDGRDLGHDGRKRRQPAARDPPGNAFR
jgi:hypothetical protein